MKLSSKMAAAAALILIVCAVAFWFVVFYDQPRKDGFNEEVLKQLGFTPIRGVVRSPSTIFIGSAGSFVSCANLWNVTVVFLYESSYVAFVYGGQIYVYEW